MTVKFRLADIFDFSIHCKGLVTVDQAIDGKLMPSQCWSCRKKWQRHQKAFKISDWHESNWYCLECAKSYIWSHLNDFAKIMLQLYP